MKIFFWQNWKNTALEAGFFVFWKITLQTGFNLLNLIIKYLLVALCHVEYRKGQF